MGIIYYFELGSRKGALQVNSTPKSKVYLNDKLVGETPLCLCKDPNLLKVGDYTIRLTPANNLNPFEEKININKSTVTVVDKIFINKSNSEGSIVSLSPIKSKDDAEIMVETLPSNANIFLDEKPVGISNIVLKNVDASDHDLRITHKGYKDKLLKIKTTLGYRLVSKVYLEAMPKNEVATKSALISRVLILDTPVGFLRVRESSSLSSTEIGKVTPGEIYELLDEKEGWFEIKLSSPSGAITSGWISSTYAEKQK